MGLGAYYLGDTSALARIGRAPIANRLAPLLEAGLVVLHYDQDFDLISSVTNQPTEWIVPAGTVP